MRSPRFAITWLLVCWTSAPILSALAGDTVPVLIWGGDAPGQELGPAHLLRKTATEDFEKFVARKIGEAQPPVIVFMRESLCSEDILQHKKDLSQLTKQDYLEYFAVVDSPLSVLKNLPSYNVSLEEDPETVLDGQLVITKATDLDAVSDTYKLIHPSSPNLIAVLTGLSCIFNKPERVRRAAVEAQAENGTTTFIIAQNESRLLAHADIAAFQKGIDGPVIHLGSPTSVVSSMNKTLGATVWVNTTFQNDAEKTDIAFELTQRSAGYYYMKRVFVTSGSETRNLTVAHEIVYPNDFSYHCSPTISFRNTTDGVSKEFWFLNFTNLQMQVDRTNFTDPYDCVGFMSIPIWSGIFVTFILGMIVIWGLTMIMDIRTMDRFDDPKGKTITVSASE